MNSYTDERIVYSRKKLGNLLGCLLAACYGDRLGRKNTLRVGGVISALGAVLQVAAFSFPQLIVGRVVNGVGNGMLSSTCGIFQAESCASGRRGKLSVIVVLHNVVFYCIATWTTLACYFTSGGWQWRLPLGLQVSMLSVSSVDMRLTPVSVDRSLSFHVLLPDLCT